MKLALDREQVGGGALNGKVGESFPSGRVVEFGLNARSKMNTLQ